MSRILQALQRREKSNGSEQTVPEPEENFFEDQATLLMSSKYSKGEVEPLFGQRGVSETDRAVVACNDFLRMGTGRSIIDLFNIYLDAKERGESVPTLGNRTLYEWSSRFHWAGRASEYDAQLEGIKNETAKSVLGSGLALTHERVMSLKTLAVKLEEEIHDVDSLWLKDFKLLGRGKDAKLVEITRFNSSLINQYRETLGDIAKETGGRVNKQELTGAGGDPLGVGVFSLEDIRTRIAKRFDDIINGENPDDVSGTT